jgi:hypothetical protein
MKSKNEKKINKKEIKDLTDNFIIGIIDSYGAVHSKLIGMSSGENHESVYPSQIFYRWSWWDDHKGIEISVLSSPINDEDFNKIERHLKRKYNI